MATKILSRLYHEIGLRAVVHSPRDSKILCLQRIVRFIAYGSSSLVFALFLSNLGISDERIGLFMTLTLLGDVVISLILTLIADGFGRRRMLMLGAAMMSASGVVFALSSNYWVLLAASVFGVISPRYADENAVMLGANCVIVAMKLALSELSKNPLWSICRLLLTGQVFSPGTRFLDSLAPPWVSLASDGL